MRVSIGRSRSQAFAHAQAGSASPAKFGLQIRTSDLPSARDIPGDVFLHRGGEGVADRTVLYGGFQMQAGAAVYILRHSDVEVHGGEFAAFFFRAGSDRDAAGVKVVLLACPCHHAEHAGGNGRGEHIRGAGVFALASRSGLDVGEKFFFGRREDALAAHVPEMGGDGCCVHDTTIVRAAFRAVNLSLKQVAILIKRDA